MGLAEFFIVLADCPVLWAVALLRLVVELARAIRPVEPEPDEPLRIRRWVVVDT